jgi:DNA repair protein RadC
MYAAERVLRVEKVTNNSFEAIKVKSSGDAARFARQFYGDDLEIFESFFLILLNRQHKTIGWVKISQGGVAGTVVDTIIIAKYAIDTLASAVILVHNHPSGNLQPSNADRQITRSAKEGLALFNISVVDHVILTVDSHYSFADSGDL